MNIGYEQITLFRDDCLMFPCSLYTEQCSIIVARAALAVRCTAHALCSVCCTGESGSEWSSPAHAHENAAEPETSAERGVRGDSRGVGMRMGRKREPQSESDGDGDEGGEGEQECGEQEQTRLLERGSPPTSLSSSGGGAALGGGGGAGGGGGGGGSAAPAHPLRIPELEQTRQLQVPFTLSFVFSCVNAWKVLECSSI